MIERWRGYAPKYYKPIEWRCKCGRCKDRASYAPLEDNLLIRLDILRAALGAPITITSGWRCNDHNAATPGASATSYHLIGRAADITAEDFPALASLAERLGKLPLHKWTELIINSERRYIHAAV